MGGRLVRGGAEEDIPGLNDQQQRAVRYVDGPLLVFAGPGTGKTRVVTHKIAHLVLHEGCRPEEVLALTFSDNAAQEMQERVEDLLPGVAGLRISTFHSFCYELVRQHSLELGINKEAKVVSDEHQQAFLLQHMDDIGLQAFAVPSVPIDLAKSFQGSIARFKQENITLQRLEQYILARKDTKDPDTEEYIEKLGDLYRAYALYESWKEENGLIDYGDMQYMAVELLKTRPSILKRLKQDTRYIIVDEYQDTDYIQLQLVLLLASEGNVTVVGDDDQSIYRFRGAYLTNIAEFKKFYSDMGVEAESIVLETNYRCTGSIQNAATALIGNNPERQNKDMRTEKDVGEPVNMTVYPTDREQGMDIARRIAELNDAGIPWSDIAILVRRRVDSKPIIEYLEKNRIPYQFTGSKQYFREPVVRAVLSYLWVLQDPNENQPSLAHIMQRPVHGILPGEMQKLNRYARDRGQTLWEALGDLSEYSGDSVHMASFREETERIFQEKGDGDLSTLLRTVLFGKDFFRVEMARGGAENIRLLNRFMRITEEYLSIYPEGTLEHYLMYLKTLSNLGLEEKEGSTEEERVNLMTIHGSKGKEFPYVFIPCLNERRIPSTYRPYKIEVPEDLQDGVASEHSLEEIHYHEERRLLYVAITRAKDVVFLSACRRYGDNKRDSPLSRFLGEVMESGICESEEHRGSDEEHVLEEATTSTGLLGHRIVSGIARGEWQASIDALTALAMHHGEDISGLRIPGEIDLEKYVAKIQDMYTEPERNHVARVKYSPSKLRCYEECPRKYNYQHVLGIPDVKKEFFELGTLVHSVVENVTRKIKGGEEVSLEEALGMMDAMWRPSVYDSRERERQDREDAEKMIRDFMEHQNKKITRIVDIERWIELDLDGRKIRGKVDRIDDNGENLEVIDYKTSRNKTSKPQLKKDFQMVLYWMGAEKALEKPVGQVGHWYLREDREWMIDMTPEERQEVLERVKSIMLSIEAQQYPAAPNHQTCKWCGYRNLCDAEV